MKPSAKPAHARASLPPSVICCPNSKPTPLGAARYVSPRPSAVGPRVPCSRWSTPAHKMCLTCAVRRRYWGMQEAQDGAEEAAALAQEKGAAVEKLAVDLKHHTCDLPPPVVPKTVCNPVLTLLVHAEKQRLLKARTQYHRLRSYKKGYEMPIKC